MKSSHFAAGLVGLAIVGLWYFAGGAEPPAARATDEGVSAPLTHENLSVYFIRGVDTVPDAKVLTLNEALERKLAVVHETSNVNVLAVENLSPEYELFIQSGDIVKGGKQDRMAATDMLLPTKSGVVPMPAHCVEHGRWTGRGGEDAKQFAGSYNFAAGSSVKYANASGQQAAVWRSVSENQSKLNASLKTSVNAAVSPTSYQLTLEAPAVQTKVAEYEAALKASGAERAGVVGVVFVVNGQVTGAEVYGSNALFRKAWPKLLNSAAVEAVAERDKPLAAAPSAREVEQFLARGADPEAADLPSDGTAGQVAVMGRSGATRAQLNRNGGGQGHVWNITPGILINEEVGLDSNLEAALPVVALDQRQLAQQLSGRRSANSLYQPRGGSVGVQEGWQPANPAPDASRVNPTVAGAESTIMGTALPPLEQRPSGNVLGGFYGNPLYQGNRLNSNRVENTSTLVVESRDPTRQNAVIHRSYIKK